MIPSINLLPYHTDRKVKRRQKALAVLAGSAVLAALATLAGGWYIDSLSDRQQHINDVLTAENAKMDVQIKEVESLKRDIEALLERQLAVEALQNERNKPVRLLEELVKIVPDGVYLTSMKQADGNFTVGGVAQSNERVSEFLHNISNVSWLDKAELVETKATTVTTSTKEQKRLYDYTIKFAYRPEPKADDAKKTGAATVASAVTATASAAAKPASGSK